MKITRLLLLLCLAPTAWAAAAKSVDPEGAAPTPPPATVGTDKKAGPQAPVKGVEEPLFQLPELVIVGENQARIMAQKEALTTSPMRGLHEAPLLEKEEANVNALRRREPPPFPGFTRSGTFAAVRFAGGTPSFLGGGAWAGRQGASGLLAVNVEGSAVKGEAVGAGTAGGWDFTAGAVAEPRPGGGWVPALKAFDLVHAHARWHESARDLPYAAGTGAERRATELTVGAELADPARSAASAGLGLTTVRTPAVGTQGAFTLAAREDARLWARGAWAVHLGGRLHSETADAVGDHLLVGGGARLAWIPSEAWRAEAGFLADGLFGQGLHAGSLRPAGGLAYAHPAGPNASLRIGGGLDAPWFAAGAAANPYSVFQAGLLPQRDLADVELSGWLERPEGHEAHLAWRMVKSRDAATWVRRPGDGLFAPAALPTLTVTTVRAGGRWQGPDRWAVFGEGRWRTIAAEAGEPANLPRAEGEVGAEWSWSTLTFGMRVEHVRSRPGSAVGGPTLAPFTDAGFRIDWRPLRRLTVGVAATNVLGTTVERWAGYPEPKRLLTASVLAVF